MAFNLNNGSGGRRSRGMPAMAEINVTPFVDVALVLLIIFMITAHVMEYGIEVSVPKTKTVASSVKEAAVVNVKGSGEIFLGSNPVNINRLVDEIHTRFPGQNTVFLRADAQTSWDIVAQVMDALGTAKFGVTVATQAGK